MNATEEAQEQNAEDESALARSVLERGDIKEIFALYEKTVKERNACVHAALILSDHYKGGSAVPRWSEPSGFVDSIERVALAAIGLARDVALPKRKK